MKDSAAGSFAESKSRRTSGCDRCMPRYQAALSRARIEYAVSSGCNLSVSITRPGTASLHNAERLGFEIANITAKTAMGA